MAEDTVLYPDATGFAGNKSFYAVKIPVSHWQLRHYISAPEADLLYYASGHDVFCLNTATKKRKHVATLPFESRCTASGYGWVCIGGEQRGHFATIRVNGTGTRTVDADSAVPLDSWRQVGPRNIKVECIGEEIVNSISIHRIQDEDAHLDDIVAVLTNNDKTVRVYSLPQGLETTVLDLPFAMNHATISPDGHTLVAVGDYNQAFFFCRDILTTPPQIPKPHNRLTSSNIGWSLINIVDLHIPSRREPLRGYFTTAWSPSGQLVALGSESGYITVFDVDMLASADFEVEDAVVAVIPSSRPDRRNSNAGAVRSMMFSPDPWDLLIWAEDQGRICIADLRSEFHSKLIVELEPKEVSMPRVSYEDVATSQPVQAANISRDIDSLETDLLSRHRHATESTPALGAAAGYIEAIQRQRQQRRQMQALTGMRGDAQSTHESEEGLSAHEHQILGSLRTSRQREEARAIVRSARSIIENSNHTTARVSNSSSNHTTSSLSLGASEQSTTRTLSTRPVDEVLSSLPELSRSRGASSSEIRPMSSHGDSSMLFETSWTPPRGSFISRLSDGSRLPRRRAVATEAVAARAGHAAAPQTGVTLHNVEADNSPWRIAGYVGFSQQRGVVDDTIRRRANGQQTLSEMRSSLDSMAGETSHGRTSSAARRRDRWQHSSALLQHRMPAYPAEYYDAILFRANQANATAAREREGVRTAGLAMSSDGRTLWAACEEGIFEMKLNVKSRMYCPATKPR